MTKDFSIGECFAVGWQRFKEHAGLFVGIAFLAWGAGMLGSILVDTTYRYIEPSRSLLDLLTSLVSYWLYFGMTIVGFRALDRQPTGLGDLLVLDWRFVRYIVATLLYCLIVVLGLICFIIPGVYLAIRYGLVWYAITDGHKTLGEAFRESALLTRGVKWHLFLFALVSLGVLILGMLAFGFGVLVATPVSLLASLHLYRVLLSQHSPAAPSTPLPSAPSTTSVAA